MVPKLANGTRKRKHAVENEDQAAEFLDGVGLDMLSDDEAGGAPESSDEEVDEFPELDPASDSEDVSEDEEEDEDEDELIGNEEADADEQESDTSVEEDNPHLYPEPKVIKSDITGRPKKVYPEIEPNYDSDSSTEEVSVISIISEYRTHAEECQDPNRVGNVPMHWYDDLPHVGYDINGKKVLRPARGDELDKFLKTVEDPSAWSDSRSSSQICTGH